MDLVFLFILFRMFSGAPNASGSEPVAAAPKYQPIVVVKRVVAAAEG